MLQVKELSLSRDYYLNDEKRGQIKFYWSLLNPATNEYIVTVVSTASRYMQVKTLVYIMQLSDSDIVKQSDEIKAFIKKKVDKLL